VGVGFLVGNGQYMLCYTVDSCRCPFVFLLQVFAVCWGCMCFTDVLFYPSDDMVGFNGEVWMCIENEGVFVWVLTGIELGVHFCGGGIAFNI